MYVGEHRGHVESDVSVFFFFQAEDGIRDLTVTGVQTCALPISRAARRWRRGPCARRAPGVAAAPRCGHNARARSEEHTSELQSQSNLVCRLLLEKKKDSRTGGVVERRRGA